MTKKAYYDTMSSESPMTAARNRGVKHRLAYHRNRNGGSFDDFLRDAAEQPFSMFRAAAVTDQDCVETLFFGVIRDLYDRIPVQ